MPPPWLPIAGKMNGLAPSALTCSTAALAITSMFTMPRLPTASATLCPGLIGRARPPSVCRTAAGMSWSIGPANCCLTRAMRGVWDARGMPVSFITTLLE